MLNPQGRELVQVTLDAQVEEAFQLAVGVGRDANVDAGVVDAGVVERQRRHLAVAGVPVLEAQPDGPI